jgi:drug/metabolite transporter (DMT)-like permease
MTDRIDPTFEPPGSESGAASPARGTPGTAAGPGSARAAGIACALLSVALFSSFTLVSRMGLASSLTTPDLAALRFGIGGVLLAPVLVRSGLRGIAWRHATALALLGGLGFALLAYTGFSLAPAAHGAVLLHGTLPLFTYLLTRQDERPEKARRRSAGTAMIAAGVALMACDSLIAANAHQLLGDALLLLASLSWSAYGVLSRRLGLPAAQGAAIVAVLSMCGFLPLYALLPGKAILAAGSGELLRQALVQGVLIGAVSIFVYTRAVAVLGAARTALFTAAVPCITTLAAIPLLGEIPSRAAACGAAIVTFGMLVALRMRTPGEDGQRRRTRA